MFWGETVLTAAYLTNTLRTYVRSFDKENTILNVAWAKVKNTS